MKRKKIKFFDLHLGCAVYMGICCATGPSVGGAGCESRAAAHGLGFIRRPKRARAAGLPSRPTGRGSRAAVWAAGCRGSRRKKRSLFQKIFFVVFGFSDSFGLVIKQFNHFFTFP